MKQPEYKFHDLINLSYGAASKICPKLTEIIGVPQSVIDLGGGAGSWCQAFKQIGSSRVCCIDHPSVLTSGRLLIDETEFIPADISKELPPIKPCDLAISTEFCEHIAKSRSEILVDFLTKSSKIVLFSAAIPRQGGIGHINEQRPNFWQALFLERGYQRIDAIRPLILSDSTIPAYLRQNLYLYVESKMVEKIPEKFRQSFIPDEFEIVETRLLERPLGLSEVIREIPLALSRAVKNRLL